MGRAARRWLLFAALLAAAAGALLLGHRLATQRLQQAVIDALGPGASVGQVRAGLTAVELADLRVRAAPGWPAGDELRAARVEVRPDLSTLWSGDGWRIDAIRIEGAYVSLLRERGGRLRLLPAVTEPAPHAQPAGTAAAAWPGLRIDRVELRDAVVDYFDASIARPAHRLRIERLQVDAGPLVLPTLDAPVQLKADGVFKGPQRDGTLQLQGELSVPSRDGRLQAKLGGADLVALQPYLVKLGEGGVRRGALTLDLDATLKRNHLNAPGKLQLSGLELAPSGGALGTFAGVPRQAVLAALSRDGRIEVRFTLQGRLDDPAFSLNENLAARIGAGLAEGLGVRIGGVVEGVGGVIRGLFGR